MAYARELGQMEEKKLNNKRINQRKFLFFTAIIFLLISFGISSVNPVNAQKDANSIRKDVDFRGFNQGLLSGQTDQLIIKFSEITTKDGFFNPVDPDQLKLLTEAAGVSLTYVREIIDGAFVLRLPARMPVEMVQAISDVLKKLPNVEYVEPDRIMEHTLTPNDTYYTNQWHYFAPVIGNYGINAPAAWDITTGSSSIVVSVVDTGITNHTEFSGRTVAGYDFIDDDLVANDGDARDSNPSDPGDWITYAESISGYFIGCRVTNSSWHGTHTAGTIGAASNNGSGVAGVNWNSKLLPVRVLGKCGGYMSDIIDGMVWSAGLSVSGVPANANPAKVISISLGGSGACETSLQNAINSILATGTTIVVAAGNEGGNASNFTPGNCNGVITVAATTNTGSRASYSNYGTVVEISAPGSNVYSTLNSGTRSPGSDSYAYYSGTSMATPHVSGVASLMYSCYPSLTPAQVLQILQNSVTPFPSGSTCTTSTCGSGIVNAGAALIMQRAFNKTAPSNGALLQPNNPVLSWGASLGATAYEYCYDTSNDNACSSWVNNGAVTSVELNSLTPNTTYYWQVRAIDNCGATYANGSSTVFWSFTTAPVYTISGNAGTAGATLSYIDGIPLTATADESGNYSFTVSYNWTGTVTPSMLGYTFTPDHRDYSNVQTDFPAQDYTAIPITYTISGNAGASGVTLNYVNAGPQSVVSDETGDYAFIIPYNWSGTVTPVLPGYTFDPVNRTYIDTQADAFAQDYTPYANDILITISMQGRAYLGDIPATLTGLVFGPYTVYSTDISPNNMLFSAVIADTYTFTTQQPRYLNITADLSKTLVVSAGMTLSPLSLMGGNAIWTDNLINIQDISKVGGAYGTGDITSDADVNFDGRVNIQDLTIVGGNYRLTSATAYETWVP